MPIRDAIFNDGTMWPVNVIVSQGIIMSHTCVNHIVVPLGKLILRGFVATHLLFTSALSMMKMTVVPVSAIASFAAMVSAFKYCGMVFPNIVQAVAMSEGWSRSRVALMFIREEWLEVMPVFSSTSVVTEWPEMSIRVGGFKERLFTETK